MFGYVSTSLTDSPNGRMDSWVKAYAVPEELDTPDLVEMAEHAACPIADMEVHFFEDCARSPERWSFDRFFEQEDELRNISSINFDIPDLNARIKINGRMVFLYIYPSPSKSLSDWELDDILGKLPEVRRERKQEKKEPLRTIFRSVSFDDELRGADEYHGWSMLKLYKLQEGKEVAPSVARFLEERPDIQESRAHGKSWFGYGERLLAAPTYLLIGSRWDMNYAVRKVEWNAACRRAKEFADREPELAAACRQNNIHVIGGTCEHFWDSFDQTEYYLSIEKYPGSADDAATYANVTLCKR